MREFYRINTIPYDVLNHFFSLYGPGFADTTIAFVLCAVLGYIAAPIRSLYSSDLR